MSIDATDLIDSQGRRASKIDMLLDSIVDQAEAKRQARQARQDAANAAYIGPRKNHRAANAARRGRTADRKRALGGE